MYVIEMAAPTCERDKTATYKSTDTSLKPGLEDEKKQWQYLVVNRVKLCENDPINQTGPV